MKISDVVNIIQLSNKIYKSIRYNIIYNKTKLKKKTPLLLYNSQFIHTLEISLELLYKLTSSQPNNNNNFLFSLLILELIKLGFTFKELSTIHNLGYSFYIDQDIFYTKLLGLSKDEYLTLLNPKTSDQQFSIPNLKGNYILPVQNNSNLKQLIPARKVFLPFKQNKLKNTEMKINFEYLGEFLYLVKPVIYITLKCIYKNNHLVTFIMNAILEIIIFTFQINLSCASFSIKHAYYEELLYRKKKLIKFIFMEPLYSKVTRPVIIKILILLPMPVAVRLWFLEFFSQFTNISYLL